MGTAWYLEDSLYLRFVILFLGNMNAWYAIFDIYLDGFKYENVQQSDATLMAQAFNQRRDAEVSGMFPTLNVMLLTVNPSASVSGKV
jgi:hypothetical protein